MSSITLNKQSYTVEDNDSVLDTLLKNGVDYPHSCKIGTCQSCLTKLVDGTVSSESQHGLKPTLVAQNYFLACQCNPENNIVIARANENAVSTPSKIIKLSHLNANVLCVRLSIDNPNLFKAGQYINLVASDSLVRSYSIADIQSNYLELHVKLIPNGLMSHWLSTVAKIGTAAHIRGPLGECFYYNTDNETFPIVLAGTGTGLAPLIGIAQDALAHKHQGEIILIHGGVDETDLYLHDTLCAIQKAHSNFTYAPCVLHKSNGIEQASIDKILIKNLCGIMHEVQLFICGPTETTNKMKTEAFLAGVPSASIHSDAFITLKS